MEAIAILVVLTSIYIYLTIKDNKVRLYALASILASTFYSYQSYNNLLSFKELPSLPIGGDLYAQLGQILYMNRTLDLIGNHYYHGKVFSYNPIYSWLALPLTKLGIDAIQAMKILSSVFTFLSIVWFIIIFKISNHPLLALVSHIFVLQFSTIVLKYTDLVIPVVAPITIYLILERKYGWALLLSFLTHNILFVTTGLLVLISIIYHKYYERPIELIAKNIIPSIILAILILMVIQRLDLELFPRLKMDFPDMTKIEAIEYIYFVYLPKYMVETLTIAFLLIYLYLLYNNRTLNVLDLWIITLGILIITSPLTDRLFGINLLPNYTINLILTPALIFGVASKYKGQLDLGLMLLLILVSINSYNALISKFEHLKNYNKNISDIPEIADMIKIINSDPGIVLSNKPISFLINAYTGINVVTSRWAQSFHLPFLNFSNRDLDAAIMLYSNNSELKNRLLKEYDVKYIVYAPYLFAATEYNINNILIQKVERGDVINSREYPAYVMDPLLCIGCIDELKANNIYYTIAEGYLDPSIRENYIRTFRVALIDFRNYDKVEIPSNYQLIYQSNTIEIYKRID